MATTYDVPIFVFKVNEVEDVFFGLNLQRGVHARQSSDGVLVENKAFLVCVRPHRLVE